MFVAMQRTVNRLVCMLAGMLSCGYLMGAELEKAEISNSRPNIVFILADDLGYADVGFMGQEKILTPRLDALAENGLVFENMYAGGPVCGPSRACLLSGMSQDVGFIKGNPGRKPERENFREEDVLFSELLKETGYRNVYFGKWGLGPQGMSGYPLNKGFDSFVGYDTHVAAHNYYPQELCKDDGKISLPEGTYTHDVFTQEALSFLDKDHEQPFMLFVGYTIPHGPYDPPDILPYENETDWSDRAKKYAAMITRMDRDVGAILDKLEVKGLTEDTLVIFTSDNGVSPYSAKEAPEFFNSNGGLRGIKRDVFDGGIKVPCVFSWPGQIEPGRTEHVASFQDFMPSLCELAGALASESCNGISFLPTLMGHEVEQAQHDYLYWEHIQMMKSSAGVQAVLDVKRNQKGIRFGRFGEVWLFDLDTDPEEKRNIAKFHPERVAAIKDIMDSTRSKSELWPISMHDTGFRKPKEE